MGIWSAISSALDALQAGRELQNAENWKKTQVWVTLLGSVFGLLGSFWPPLQVPPEAIGALATTIVMFVNIYLTFATSARVGVPREPPAAPSVPGGSTLAHRLPGVTGLYRAPTEPARSDVSAPTTEAPPTPKRDPFSDLDRVGG